MCLLGSACGLFGYLAMRVIVRYTGFDRALCTVIGMSSFVGRWVCCSRGEHGSHVTFSALRTLLVISGLVLLEELVLCCKGHVLGMNAVMCDVCQQRMNVGCLTDVERQRLVDGPSSVVRMLGTDIERKRVVTTAKRLLLHSPECLRFPAARASRNSHSLRC